MVRNITRAARAVTSSLQSQWLCLPSHLQKLGWTLFTALNLWLSTEFKLARRIFCSNFGPFDATATCNPFIVEGHTMDDGGWCPELLCGRWKLMRKFTFLLFDSTVSWDDMTTMMTIMIQTTGHCEVLGRITQLAIICRWNHLSYVLFGWLLQSLKAKVEYLKSKYG